MNENRTSPRHSDEQLAPVNALPVGSNVQEFEIKAIIGEGGFGIVYRAFDTLLGREVAIKEYLPVSHATRLADGTVVASSERQRNGFEKGLRYFIAEARMLARFKHPALVEILRFWEAQGTAYMVMPYYHGRPLHALIQEGFRLTDDASLRAFLNPLLDGLAQLHTADCFHRDISTDNILMLASGQPLLLDFGAARSVLVNKSEVSTVILKPGFAPIEQYSDAPDTAPQGAWTDIYALSAVIYQAMTGVMPTVSVARIIHDPLIPLSQRALPGFSPGVLAAIDAGLRVAPAERPQSVQALRELMTIESMTPPRVLAMEVAAPDEGPMPGQASAPPPLPAQVPVARDAALKSRKKRPLLLAGALFFLVLIAVFAGLYFGGDDGLITGSKMVVETTSEQIMDQPMPPMPPDDANQGADHDNPEDSPDELTAVIETDDGDERGTHEALPEGGAATQEAAQPPPVHAHGGTEASTDGDSVSDAGRQDSEQETLMASSTQAIVVVSVQPWADVYAEGELKGTAPPALRLHLQPGERTLELRNDAYPAKRVVLNLKAGQIYRISHVFHD